MRHEKQNLIQNKPDPHTKTLSQSKATEIHKEGGFLSFEANADNSSPSAKDAMTAEFSETNPVPSIQNLMMPKKPFELKNIS